VIAPKTLKATKGSMLLAFTPQTPGTASVALLKGAKVIAKKAATFGGAGTYSVKLALPRKLKAGGYQLKISFTAVGAPKATTKTLAVKVTKAGRAGKARAARSGGPIRGTAASEEAVGAPAQPAADDRDRLNPRPAPARCRPAPRRVARARLAASRGGCWICC
jgi:hypothetical protein